MPDRSDVVLLYDGSFDGFLSAVFVSYLHRPAPLSVEPQDGVQQQFGVTYLPVETDDAQAQRTAGGIRRIMGQEAYETVWKAFLAENALPAAPPCTVTSALACASVPLSSTTSRPIALLR